MKKKSLLILSLALMLVFITACTTTDDTNGTNNDTNEDNIVAPESPAGQDTPMSPSVPTESTALKLGLGIVSNATDSTAAGVNTLGNAQNRTIVCAVAVDENNVIQKIKFDSVESALEFDAKGMFTNDVNAPIKTQKEMGYDYGLAETSEIGKEWFEQIGSFEDWATGRNVDDVIGMELNEENIPTAEELKSSVSIGVSDQLEALQKAYDDAKA